MKRKTKTIFTALLILCLSTTALTACSKTQNTTAATGTTSTSTESTASTADTANSNTVVGQVTAIDGSKVTLALGELSSQGPSGDKQDMPNAPTDDSNAAPPSDDGQNTPPSGDPGANAPSGDPGANGHGGNGGFTASGEESTITIADESLISIMSPNGNTTGSLSDITVDSILTIAYDSSNNIQSITVSGQGGGQGNPPPDTSDNSTTQQ